MISRRRNMLDEILFAHEQCFSGKLLDIGGERTNNRGNFRFKRENENYYERITLNISKGTKPDVLGSAENLPFDDDYFDIITCLEVLEHLKSPESCFSEFTRVIKPGGSVFLSAPWMVGIHGDPDDYFRYTPSAIHNLADKNGLSVTKTIVMGDAVDALLDALRSLHYSKSGLKPHRIITYLILKAFSLRRPKLAEFPRNYSKFSTGYFFEIKKFSNKEM